MMVVVDSLLRYLITEKRYSSLTVRAYKTDLMQFEKFVSDHAFADQLTDCNTKHIRSWVIALLDNGTSPRSVNRKTTSLRRFYRFCQQEGVIKNNPAEAIPSLKTARPLPVFLEEAQMDSLSVKADKDTDFVIVRNILILELLYGTGMRLSELTGLHDRDTDVTNNQLKVFGKRQKERMIPVTGSLATLICLYREIREKEFPGLVPDYLILTESGKPAYQKLIYRVVKEALNGTSFSGRKSPHVLRHTYATHLLNRGAEINAIKELLGHASLSATQVYTHTGFEKLKKVFQKAHPRA